MKKIKESGDSLTQAMPKIEDDKTTETEPTEWETKDHLDTLMRAHEIMNNPTKLAKVHKLAGRHTKAMRGIQDLKDHYNEKFGGKNALKSLAGGGSADADGE